MPHRKAEAPGGVNTLQTAQHRSEETLSFAIGFMFLHRSAANCYTMGD
jgi:hypothetical protein